MDEEMPQPTIWPATLALGLVSASFGIVTVGIFFYAGVLLTAFAAAGWIRDLLAQGRVEAAEPVPPAIDPAEIEEAR